jgi:ABC-type antimicrobial peptide transport system permease subunit
MDSNTGKYLIVGGILIVVLGVIIYFFHDKLQWIGRLPGDIRFEKENFRFYFPITTMILFSLIATAIIFVVKRWL